MSMCRGEDCAFPTTLERDCKRFEGHGLMLRYRGQDASAGILHNDTEPGTLVGDSGGTSLAAGDTLVHTKELCDRLRSGR